MYVILIILIAKLKEAYFEEILESGMLDFILSRQYKIVHEQALNLLKFCSIHSIIYLGIGFQGDKPIKQYMTYCEMNIRFVHYNNESL